MERLHIAINLVEWYDFGRMFKDQKNMFEKDSSGANSLRTL